MGSEYTGNSFCLLASIANIHLYDLPTMCTQKKRTVLKKITTLPSNVKFLPQMFFQQCNYRYIRSKLFSLLTLIFNHFYFSVSVLLQC